MNSRRIMVGGLAAGVVLMVGEIGIEPLMAPSMEQFFGRLGLSVPGESAMIALAGIVLTLGLLSVWLYAALVPRFGPGMRTAALVGLVAWTLSCLLPNITMFAFGVLDSKLFWLWSAWPLIESIVATMAGAAVHDRGTIPGATKATRPSTASHR